ncbi:MAG: hypothetical protein WAU89_13465 [Candidatus Acidiferrales bacterium]
MDSRLTLCVDFDGVIFDGLRIFPGCVEALARLQKIYRISIYSARLTAAERQQMKSILDNGKVPYDEILERKPEAVAYIDDKAVKFEGWDKIPCAF